MISAPQEHHLNNTSRQFSVAAAELGAAVPPTPREPPTAATPGRVADLWSAKEGYEPSLSYVKREPCEEHPSPLTDPPQTTTLRSAIPPPCVLNIPNKSTRNLVGSGLFEATSPEGPFCFGGDNSTFQAPSSCPQELPSYKSAANITWPHRCQYYCPQPWEAASQAHAVKQEPVDVSEQIVCHPNWKMAGTSNGRCGCDITGLPTVSHFLCSESHGEPVPNFSFEQYGELLKRSSVLLVDEAPPKVNPCKERPHACPQCGKTFLLKHHLATHARKHSGDRPFRCDECGKSFGLKHCLVTHQRLHSGLRPFQCIECKKSFTLKHHMVLHLRTHSKDRPFSCEVCGRAFTQQRNLVAHGKLHSRENPFQCSVCGERFAEQMHLVAHSRFHGGDSAFVCNECGKTFPRKYQLVEHRKQHGHSPFSCEFCGKEFLQKRTYTAHLKLHNDGKLFCCKLCKHTFTSMTDLVTHSRQHTCYTCKGCGRVFEEQEALVAHLQTHGADLTNLSLYAEQMLTNPTPPKQFRCTDCGAGYAQKHGLVQHVRRKHNTNTQPSATTTSSSTDVNFAQSSSYDGANSNS